MTTATPALNRAVLHVLGHANVERGMPITDTWRALTMDLSPQEAAALPLSLGLALRLLYQDTSRLELAADLAVTYELYETAPYFLELAEQLRLPWAWLAAAVLVAHPGSERFFRDRLQSQLRPNGLPASLNRALQIRLAPDVPATNELEELLLLQRWPGLSTARFRQLATAPIVAIAENGLPKQLLWQLASKLRLMGAEVRRIPAEFKQSPQRGWLAEWIPIIARSPGVVSKLRELGQSVTGAQVAVLDPAQISERNLREVIETVSTLALRLGGKRLEQEAPSAQLQSDVEVVDRRVYTQGTYTAPEIAYLSGGSSSRIYHWARTIDVMAPRRIEGLYYWQFNHLVALRAYHWFGRITGKRISRRVITGLAEFAGRDQPGQVAVTASGEVLVVENEEEIHSIINKQGVIPEVARLDTTFQPFELGGGTVVPGLLEPTPGTRVHPAVLGGTPTLKRSRIACTTIARLVDQRGRLIVREVYPFLSEAQIGEAAEVGHAILSRK